MKLKDARTAAGMTQQELADKSGVYIRQIQRIELETSKAANMTAKNLLSIADTLNIDPHDLIE